VSHSPTFLLLAKCSLAALRYVLPTLTTNTFKDHSPETGARAFFPAQIFAGVVCERIPTLEGGRPCS
jgi:hypothetical protein